MGITTVSEAKIHLPELIDRVLSGEEIVIGEAGEPVAKLVPYQRDKGPRALGGSWEGRVEMAEDFDDLPKEILDAFTNGP